MTKSRKKLDSLCACRPLRTTITATALWVTLFAVCLADDDQPAPADSVPKTFNASGVVKDALVGKPIKDAKITISKLSKSRSAGGEVLEQFHATTDANGKYTFALPTDQAWDQALVTYNNGNPVSAQPGIPLEIDIKHTDYAPGRLQQTIRLVAPPPKNTRNGFFLPTPFDPAARSLPLVTLRPGKEVTGIVQSADGKPLAGIKVVAHSQVLKNEREVAEVAIAGARGSTELIEARNRLPQPVADEVETDAAGRFRVVMITPGEGMLAVVPQKDYGPVYQTLYDQRGDVGVIKLEAGQEIRGRVVDLDDKPLADQRVQITPWEPSEPAYSDPSVIQQPGGISRIDEDGKFVAGPLGAGEHRVEVMMDQYPGSPEYMLMRGLIFVPQKLKIVAGQPLAPLSFRAAPTVSIEGTIAQSSTGPNGFVPQFIGRPMTLEGVIGEMSYRSRVNYSEGFKFDAPLGLKDAVLDLLPTSDGQGTPPQWRMGDSGPLQNTSKIQLGTLNKSITDLQIIYPPSGMIQPNGAPAAAARARAGRAADVRAGRAADAPAGRRGRNAAPVPVPADTNDDSK